MVQLGDAEYVTDKDGTKHLQLEESVKAFAQHMTDMKNNVDNFDSYLRTGPRGTLEFVDDSGNQNMQSPTEIRAYNGSTYFALNNNGISFKDSQGNDHALFGVDDSTGNITGNFFVDEAHIPMIDASHIETDTIHSLGTINGNLKVSNGGITVQIGDVDNTWFLNATGGVFLSSDNYMSQLSSGSLNIHSQITGNSTHIGPNQAQIGGLNVVVTSSSTTTLGDWIKKYWRGSSKDWDL